MNNDDLLDKQIERFVHNRMSAEERLAFENDLKADIQLKKAVEELIVLKSLYDPELFALMERLNAAIKELENENFFEQGGQSPTSH